MQKLYYIRHNLKYNLKNYKHIKKYNLKFPIKYIIFVHDIRKNLIYNFRLKFNILNYI